MKIFVDTNILIDLICNREEFADEAEQLFALAYQRKVTIVISALSYVNTVYISKKYGLSLFEVKDSLIHISSFTETADCNSEVVAWALSCNWKDYEDAIQYKSAQSSKCTSIITRNPKDFKNSTLPVYSIEEFCKAHF